MKFIDLQLDPALLKALEKAGHHTATPIQEEAIPQILDGRDVMASAPTGTGKTAAFLLPILHKIATHKKLEAQESSSHENSKENSHEVNSEMGFRKSNSFKSNKFSQKKTHAKALVLAPTRELAYQIADNARLYSLGIKGFKVAIIVGGVSYPQQYQQLSSCDLIIATPGRLIDHIERKTVSLKHVEYLVLDEADRMLDMGFAPDVEKIVAQLQTQRQTLLFSATLKGAVEQLIRRILTNPVEITLTGHVSNLDQKAIEQRLVYVDDLKHKNKLLEHFLSDVELKQTIVFAATKRHVDQLSDDLCKLGHRAAPLHGDMSQRARNRTIDHMRRGSVRILVATDVAARGIDLSGITHVINFDVPRTSDEYVHRIGRTGRVGGQQGVAISFVAQQDVFLVKKVERELGSALIRHTVPGLEHQANINEHDTTERAYGNRRNGGRRSGGFGGGQRRGNWSNSGPRRSNDRGFGDRNFGGQKRKSYS